MENLTKQISTLLATLLVGLASGSTTQIASLRITVGCEMPDRLANGRN